MKRRSGISSIILCTSTLLVFSGCGKQTAQADLPRPVSPVTVSTTVSRDVPVYLDEIGKSGAFESVTVTPQVSGRIMERSFQDGANLKRGQLLFTIDPRPFQAQLDAAKAQLAQAKASLELAQSQLKMYQSITDTRAISQLDFETKKNSVNVDLAQVQAAEAAVENAQLNLDYCYIHAPIDGRAGARMVDVGNVVKSNDTSLLLIQHLDPIYADFTVTERDLAEVKRQMAAGTLRTLVRLPTEPENVSRTGTLTFLDNAIQDQTGTVKLRATVPNSDQHFWPGQFVNIRLILSTQKGALLIPSQATGISQQGPFAYVVKSDDTVELRMVELGQRHGNDVVVSKGLANGDRVVLTGQMALHPGAKVRVAADSATPGDQAGAGPGGKS